MITSCMAFYPCLDLAKTEMFYTQVVGLRTVFASDTVRIFHAKQGYFAFVAYGDGKIPANTCACRSIAPTGRASMRNTSASAHSAFSRRAPCAASIPTGLFVLFGGPERLRWNSENRWIPAYIAENFIFYKRPHKRKLSRATHALHF